jgi:hypothetical protein
MKDLIPNRQSPRRDRNQRNSEYKVATQMIAMFDGRSYETRDYRTDLSMLYVPWLSLSVSEKQFSVFYLHVILATCF